MAEVTGIECRELGLKGHGRLHVITFEWPDLDTHPSHQRHGIGQGLRPTNGQIGVQQFLKHLRRCAQPGIVRQRVREKSARLRLQGMRPAHGVHEDVGVDKDHVSVAPRRRDASMT
jgi:GNAT superfamily N-acetyltransferase